MSNKKNSSNKKSNSNTKNSTPVEVDNDGIEVGIGISNYVFIFIALVAIALIIYFIVRRKDENVKAITGDDTPEQPLTQTPVQPPTQPPTQTPVQPPEQTPVQPPVSPPYQQLPTQAPIQSISDTTTPSSDDLTSPENSHKWAFPIALGFFITGLVFGLLFMINAIDTIKNAKDRIMEKIYSKLPKFNVSNITVSSSFTAITALLTTTKMNLYYTIAFLCLVLSVAFASYSVGHSVRKDLCTGLITIDILFILALFIYKLVQNNKVKDFLHKFGQIIVNAAKEGKTKIEETFTPLLANIAAFIRREESEASGTDPTQTTTQQKTPTCTLKKTN